MVAMARAVTARHRKVRSPSGRIAGKAAGAVSGQLTQALGSFVIQAVAARELGLSGFGVFAVMYGSIILATAISSGLIGDSLTVLDRHDRATRAALQNWCVIVSSSAGVVAAGTSLAIGTASTADALGFGLLAFIFIIEDALRRALMAVLKFWRLPVVDLASFAASLVYLRVCAVVGVRLTVSHFLFAVLAGQLAAAILAVVLLPAEERPVLAARTTHMTRVFGFGMWRAAQQSVRPGLLTVMRLLVTVIAGIAVYGRLEAARVYMAPALLVVTGMGSLMLPMWVKRRNEGLRRLLQRADHAAAALGATTLIVGGLGAALLPIAGPVVTGGRYEIEGLAVFGWAVYAASSAAVTPYGTLAALQAGQGRVVAMRLVEPAVGLLALVIALWVFDLSASWTPYLLALGSFASGYAIRAGVLVPRLISSAGPRTHPPDLAPHNAVRGPALRTR